MLPIYTKDRLIGWCRQALRFVLPMECVSYGTELGSDPVPCFCTTCWQNIRPLQQPTCAICSFKNRGTYRLAKPLARLMIDALSGEIDVDMIIPVPLHQTRLREREFNQSLLLADQLGQHLAKPVVATGLVRIAATDP